MEVIGAGFGRTGTLSMRGALSRLLGGPCYHMASLIEDPRQLEHWYRWAVHPERSPDWPSILAGYAAGVDAPICFFVEELMERYPDAKVVLTVRDPEKWLVSFQNLMRTNIRFAWLGLFSARARRFGKLGRTLGRRFVGRMSRDTLLRAFAAHNERIQRIVPSSRLLVMHVQEGWEPLCRFLGKPIPDEPFPHENEGTKTIASGHWQVAFGRSGAVALRPKA